MYDPLSEIEDAKAQVDIGRTAYRIWFGTRAEGASRVDAMLILCGWFKAMFYAAAEQAKDDEEEVEEE